MRAPLVAAVLETAASEPGRDAVVCGARAVSYGELAAGVRRAAGALAGRGAVAGDRVILPAEPRPEFVFGYLACHALGAVAVPVDARLPAEALAALVARARPRLTASLADLEAAGPDSDTVAEVALDDVADVLFTTGTTGTAKGVMQTHRNILAFARGRNAAVGASSSDRVLIPLPLNHGFALGRLRATMLAGGTVILSERFLPGDVLGAFERSGANALCCVPAGLAALFRLSGDALGAHAVRLNYLETATAPLTDDLRERLTALFPNTRLFNSYGLTETTSTIAFADLRTAAGGRASVGRPVPGVELKLVDGRVHVRGEHVMKGYYDDAALTRAVLDGGWLATTDLGTIDADGSLYLTGRLDELINVGGLKVAPLEVEDALKKHPGVSDCACVGIDDPSGVSGQAVKAYLIAAAGAPRPAPEELAAYLRRSLESYKIPLQFAWVTALPRTPLGKLQRARLKDS